MKTADHPNNKIRNLIGTPTQRLEGPEKVSGQALFATDVVLPEMLWCKVLRSPISHGRITKIDTSRALALPGVHAVATGEDVKGLLIGRKISSRINPGILSTSPALPANRSSNSFSKPRET